VLIRQAGENGQLYGSVTARDISDAVTEAGFTLDRRQVVIDRPIKELGVHAIRVTLHPEVQVTVKTNVAQSQETAVLQAAAAEPAPVAEPQPAEDAEAAEAKETPISEAEAGPASNQEAAAEPDADQPQTG
jgi:large subunit ribosomal protein L9